MNPLEELEAAHKRLSELRDNSLFADPGPWSIDGPGKQVRLMGAVGEITYEPAILYGWTAELIVTLHRTIDAQLRLLELGIARVRGGIESRHGGAYQAALDLARAINEEAS